MQAAASLTGVALTAKHSGVLAAEKPNSLYKGVQLGTITYSYRTMPDQSAEAILGYIVDSGISAVELMGPPAEEFAGAPPNPAPQIGRLNFLNSQGRLSAAEREQYESLRPAFERYVSDMRRWRSSASMDRFAELREMYAAAGVGIYAFKPDVFAAGNSDAEANYGFQAAKALGASHCTVELPNDPADSLRLGRLAEHNGIAIAYHTHEQASLDVFDTAFAQSRWNRSNVDLGHYVAAPGGRDPLAFLRKHHDRIASVHLKDRQTPENGAGNLAWGTGDTPLVQILQMIRDEGFGFPATIEVEYAIPENSDAVAEVRRCVEFCKAALDA
jgi:sugar phosphate isomerase/epimerase